jgi:hypothetical protein
MLSVPEFGEEDEPGNLFHEDRAGRQEQAAVEGAQADHARVCSPSGSWPCGPILTRKKNAGLAEHELVKSVFSGGSGGGDGSLHAEDYLIDERPEALQPLIYDADSSQHSAILDVLSGKKSGDQRAPGHRQIADDHQCHCSRSRQGQKKCSSSPRNSPPSRSFDRRLNHVGLGHFCLELHSHKTQKKKFLEDIQARLEERFPGPAQFQAKLAIPSNGKRSS